MKALQFGCIVVAMTIVGINPTIEETLQKTLSVAPAHAATQAPFTIELPSALLFAALPTTLYPTFASREEDAAVPPEREQARPDEHESSPPDASAETPPPKGAFSYLVYYAYSELPPDKKPADTVLDSMKDIPLGTPIEEIKRVSDAFGLDFNFMKAVAKIESDFDPKQRTGSYIGLYQLSKYEFGKYGSGDILNSRDNSVAAAYKILTEGVMFELAAHKKPDFSDLYLIHQQGWQGAAEHMSHPERLAWKSMCATDEGQDKGEKWCKRAIWGNTLPSIKKIWKSVDKMTSGAFVDMWRERLAHFYTRYSEAVVSDANR